MRTAGWTDSGPQPSNETCSVLDYGMIDSFPLPRLASVLYIPLSVRNDIQHVTKDLDDSPNNKPIQVHFSLIQFAVSNFVEMGLLIFEKS